MCLICPIINGFNAIVLRIVTTYKMSDVELEWIYPGWKEIANSHKIIVCFKMCY